MNTMRPQEIRMIFKFHSRSIKQLCYGLLLVVTTSVYAQEAYFIDGFHGGVWGHYPEGYTGYIVSQMEKHPDWYVNLEIEPDTWDRVYREDFENFKKFKNLFQDQSASGRIEYTNPSYGQAYLFNISGESIISQFQYGIKKLKGYFPELVFSTYSSEEPCFTSALPAILNAFDVQQASLKNPNTCWGGYIGAYGGELVNWIGSDGSQLITVPRYEIEGLKANSTWETDGNDNSKSYIKQAFDYGIEHPLGMTLQDAGWKWGPWLKKDFYKPSIYITWRNYFDNVVDRENSTDWNLTQEDIKVSLVWGSQIMQQLAQQIKKSERKIVQAEKLAFFNTLTSGEDFPEAGFESAWQPLLLAQHHDCWIVPYNTSEGTSWAEKVVAWTQKTDAFSDSILQEGDGLDKTEQSYFIKVMNTLGQSRDSWVGVKLPSALKNESLRIENASGEEVESFINDGEIRFKASAPSFGYSVYKIKEGRSNTDTQPVSVSQLADGTFILESDLYQLKLDPRKGGSITSLIAKELNNKEFVDADNDFGFNIMSGNFYDQEGRLQTTAAPVEIEILEHSAEQVVVKLKGAIAGSPYSQWITLANGNARIDFKLKIDWNENTGIGAFKEVDYQARRLKKAFYNDREKLVTTFPLALEGQQVYKNAPFDVLKSNLENTFFENWDTIKNNIILDWVDVVDEKQEYGCTLITDHTTSYTHGSDFPLGLTTQYSGRGLWGRDYKLTGPTTISYALIPHKGLWDEAALEQKRQQLEEPLLTSVLTKMPKQPTQSVLQIETPGWLLSRAQVFKEERLLRIYNAENEEENGIISFTKNPGTISVVNLNGRNLEEVEVVENNGVYQVALNIPRFGFTTLKITTP